VLAVEVPPPPPNYGSMRPHGVPCIFLCFNWMDVKRRVSYQFWIGLWTDLVINYMHVVTIIIDTCPHSSLFYCGSDVRRKGLSKCHKYYFFLSKQVLFLR
jgi:hypothetical protein